MLPLIRMEPNLTSLYVIGSWKWDAEGLPVGPLVLPQLLKLRVEEPMLGSLLRWQDRLRDLEYYFSRSIEGREFVRALSPVKDMMARLCYVFLLGNANVDVAANC